MCDIIKGIDHPGSDLRGYLTEGETELTILLEEEDDIWINSHLLGLGGKVLCKHPDTDWHEMGLEPGKALHCPAETELKFILPFPYSKYDPRFKTS